MPGFPNIQVDQISFWLGFLTASLFWWFISRLKGYFPVFQEYFRQRKEAAQKKSLSSLEIAIRQETLRRSQYQHLAHSLFSLEEILVPPRLIPPPIPFDPDQDSKPISLIDQTIPYFPDCPELSAQYSTSTISPQHLIESKANIALIGNAGSGKTVTLAYIATLIAKSNPETETIASFVPIFLHILDINYEKAQEADDPLALISEAYKGFLPLTVQSRFSRFLQNAVSEGRVLFLLDGLDELPPASLKEAALFLKLLLERYPAIRFITTISPHDIDGLGVLPIHFVGIAAWNREECRQYFAQWGKQWNTHLAPEIERKYSLEPLNPQLITNWLLGENRYYTPLEWTLLLWAIYAGDITEIKLHEALDVYLQRFTGALLPRQALEKLALNMCYNQRISYRYDEIEKFFAKYTPDIQAQQHPEEEIVHRTQEVSKKQPVKVSSSGRAINSLLELGIFTEHAEEEVRFGHPLIIGYLAGCAAENEDENILHHQFWSAKILAAQFMVSRGQATQWAKKTVIQQDFPLHKNFILCVRAVKDVSGEYEWKTAIMRRLVELLHDERLPLLAKSRMLAGMINSNDPLVATLMRQLLRSNSATVRQLAALGCGALQDGKA
ncbi:MAG: NACHT domain-containing protein, partial [Anaerolineales bacterium]